MPFKKGQSGNPGGRPKQLEDVKALARAHTTEAVKTLVSIMRDSEADPARVAAANAVLDRGWGKASQTMDVNLRHSFTDALRELERIRRAESAAVGTGVAEIGEQPAPLRH